MNSEFNISDFIGETVEMTARLEKRWNELSFILSVLYDPLVLNNNHEFRISENNYDFDDFLVLMFEFVQLTKIFYRHGNTCKELENFCALYSSRLVTLCLNKRLDYIEDIIVFREQLFGGGGVSDF